MAITSDEIALAVLTIYTSLSVKVHGKYTILAAFVLCNSFSNVVKVISLSTGSKCLPTARLPTRGDALHDSHAEVLARRGAIRWLLEEIGRQCANPAASSDWITKGAEQFILKEEGGDASTRYIASFQDEEMAILKNSTEYPTLGKNDSARGRDNYALFGVLRTKPGRADSPPTSCMSCSDKIAAWNVLGFQGALACRFFKPLYISNVIIGDVSGAMQDAVRSDCERAFWRRIEGVRGLPPGYEVHKPSIQFTSLPFSHSRPALSSPNATPCNESLCWIADSHQPFDILINGLKRGVSPKHRHRESFRPQLCRIVLFKLYKQTLEFLKLPVEQETATYFRVKQSIFSYQTAKQGLIGDSCPFSGWQKTSPHLQNFDLSGDSQPPEILLI